MILKIPVSHCVSIQPLLQCLPNYNTRFWNSMIIHKRSSFLILGQNSFLFFSSPDVGYVQGMNDVLSRFLIVLGSEAQAYWCFTNYMETVKRDFLDDGMLDKISKFVILSHCCLCPCMLDLTFFFVFWFSCCFYLFISFG